MRRILTALIAVPILIYIIGFTDAVYFDLAVALSATLALEEYFALASQSGVQVYRSWGHFLSLMMLVAFYLNPNNQSIPFLILCLSAVLFLVLGLRKGEQLHQVLPCAAGTLLGLAYIPASLGLLIVIRSEVELGSQGSSWIFFLLSVVWFGDTGAYYAGRMLGRHKLAPLISPKKTIEGSLGGLVGNTLAAILGKSLLLPQHPLLRLLLLAWVLGVVSQIGDLAESALKRGAGVKDSSSLLPGHGGMLDRIDGVLFAVPVLFCYTKFVGL
jgi:phosphatidate cytidylyltransferase